MKHNLKIILQEFNGIKEFKNSEFVERKIFCVEIGKRNNSCKIN